MLRRIAAGALALTALPGLTACSSPTPPVRAAAVAQTPSTASTTSSPTTTTTTSPPAPSTTTTMEPPPTTLAAPTTSSPPPRARAAPGAPEEIEALITAEFGPIADQALTVAWCESRYRPGATNGPSRGLFQVHEVHADQWLDVIGRTYWSSWDDPAANAAFAHWLHDETGSWRAWSCRP